MKIYTVIFILIFSSVLDAEELPPELLNSVILGDSIELKNILSSTKLTKLSDDAIQLLMLQAISNDYPDIVEILVTAGANINMKFNKYDSPLHFGLCIFGRGNIEPYDAILKILELGASVNKNEHYCNALKGIMLDDRLSNRKDIKLFKLLLKKGLNPNNFEAGKEIHNPVNTAIQLNLLNHLKLLVEYGADINKNSRADSIYIEVYPVRQDEILNKVYKNYALGPNSEMFEYLLSVGVDPHQVLYKAILNRDLRTVKRLLKLGANPNMIIRNQGSYLMYAVRYEEIDISNALIKFGADKELNYKGEIAFIIARDRVKNKRLACILRPNHDKVKCGKLLKQLKNY